MKQLNFVLLLILIQALTQPAYSQKSEGSSVRLTVPKAPWTMFISGETLVLDKEQIKPDGRQGYFMLTDEKAQVFASLFIEPVDKCKTSKECRDMVWKLGNPSWQSPQNVRLSQSGEISTLEFL